MARSWEHRSWWWLRPSIGGDEFVYGRVVFMIHCFLPLKSVMLLVCVFVSVWPLHQDFNMFLSITDENDLTLELLEVSFSSSGPFTALPPHTYTHKTLIEAAESHLLYCHWFDSVYVRNIIKWVSTEPVLHELWHELKKKSHLVTLLIMI